MAKITRALISVSHKEGVLDFARGLPSWISRSCPPADSQDAPGRRRRGEGRVGVHGIPEMLDGRVKTLHPKVHGGLLGRRSNPSM